jgi:hypothetical protein
MLGSSVPDRGYRIRQTMATQVVLLLFELNMTLRFCELYTSSETAMP